VSSVRQSVSYFSATIEPRELIFWNSVELQWSIAQGFEIRGLRVQDSGLDQDLDQVRNTFKSITRISMDQIEHYLIAHFLKGFSVITCTLDLYSLIWPKSHVCNIGHDNNTLAFRNFVLMVKIFKNLNAPLAYGQDTALVLKFQYGA
jgi:hypothetical protein